MIGSINFENKCILLLFKINHLKHYMTIFKVEELKDTITLFSVIQADFCENNVVSLKITIASFDVVVCDCNSSNLRT